MPTATFRGAPQDKIQDGDVGPPRADPEHARHEPDDHEKRQPGPGSMHPPFNHLPEGRLAIHPINAQSSGKSVAVRHLWKVRPLRHAHDRHDGKHQRAEGGLDKVRREGKPDHGPHDGRRRGNQRHGEGQTEVGEISPEKLRPRRQRPRKGHEKPSRPHKVQVKREKSADDGHEESATP